MAAKKVAKELTVASLPLRLHNFFGRYPPQYYSAAAIPLPSLSELQKAESESTAASEQDSSPPSTEQTPESPPQSSADLLASIPSLPSAYSASRQKGDSIKKKAFSPSKSILRSLPGYPNPFLPQKNPETGRWRGAAVSARRQAELVKLAAQHGVEELLPPGMKSSEYKVLRTAEKGLRVKGTGIGQLVKGHKWERTMNERLEKRRQAMLNMPAMIREWKQRGHGRGWKNFPRVRRK